MYGPTWRILAGIAGIFVRGMVRQYLQYAQLVILLAAVPRANVEGKADSLKKTAAWKGHLSSGWFRSLLPARRFVNVGCSHRRGGKNVYGPHCLQTLGAKRPSQALPLCLGLCFKFLDVRKSVGSSPWLSCSQAMQKGGLLMHVSIFWGILWYPIMENQMEKKMENEMETGIIHWLYYSVLGSCLHLRVGTPVSLKLILCTVFVVVDTSSTNTTKQASKPKQVPSVLQAPNLRNYALLYVCMLQLF